MIRQSRRPRVASRIPVVTFEESLCKIVKAKALSHLVGSGRAATRPSASCRSPLKHAPLLSTRQSRRPPPRHESARTSRHGEVSRSVVQREALREVTQGVRQPAASHAAALGADVCSSPFHRICQVPVESVRSREDHRRVTVYFGKAP
jgi:hypothetical protein